MKKIYLLLVSLFLINFTACSNIEVGFEEDSIFYQGSIVYIYLDKEIKKGNNYRVYIDGEDTEVSLVPGYKTRFGIKPKDVTIMVVHGKERASIALSLKASKEYYLSVKELQNGKITILEVAKERLKNSKSTSLYVDEKEEIKKEVKREKKDSQDENQESSFSYEPIDW